MTRILKEPLLHFLLIGAGLFVIFGLVKSDDEVRGSGDTIVVSPSRIEQLAKNFAKTWQRPPNEQELKGLVDDFVLEEIYYRQAIEMGIDRDDLIIRRRLRQKVEIFTDDMAGLVEPSDADLGKYLEDNADKFLGSSTYTFRHIYFNPKKHPDDFKTFLDAQLKALNAGQDVRSDSGLIRADFQAESTRVIDNTFGKGFAIQLDELETGSWTGPVESGLGIHLVRVDSREPGAVPPLDQIKSVVEREWANERRIEVREKMNEQLRGEYEIVIEWPEEK